MSFFPYIRTMILVTGATGLLGTHLLYQLLQTENTVRAIYRDKSKLDKVKSVFSYYSDEYMHLYNRIEWVEAEILDIPSLCAAFNGIDRVYHSAAVVAFDSQSEKLMNKINIEGSANIVNMCLDHNVRLCHVSSIATLGSPLSDIEINEGELWNPDFDNSGYAISKNGAEMEVWRGIEEGLNAVIVNPSIILGPGFWDSGSGKLFSTVKNGMKFYTKGITGFVGVYDVCIIMCALMNSDISAQRFIINASNLSYREVFTSIANNLSVKAPSIKASRLMLNIAWRLESLRSFVFGGEKKLSKYSARSSMNIRKFSNKKISKKLSYEFESIDKVILNISSIYLKEE